MTRNLAQIRGHVRTDEEERIIHSANLFVNYVNFDPNLILIRIHNDEYL